MSPGVCGALKRDEPRVLAAKFPPQHEKALWEQAEFSVFLG